VKILFLPENIASMPAITTAALNKIDGVNARFITNSLNKYCEINESIIYEPRNFSRRKPIKYIFNKIRYIKVIKKWIKWADILHYTWSAASNDGSDLRYAKKLGKPIFIEWVGSDIRNPEFLKKINKFYLDALLNGYEYKDMESKDQSIKNQKLFLHHGAIPTLCPEMKLYLDINIFQRNEILFQRINIRNFKPIFPLIKNEKVVIVHSPSAKVAKGSEYIISIVEKLKKNYNIDFKLLHGLPRVEVLQLIQSSDIFIDQIILGSYGMAAMEAMSFGKPVMCYIIPEVFEAGLPEECPIVNTNPENIEEQLIRLITQPELRNKLGKESREFVEKYHDVDKVAGLMLEMYRKAIKGSL
jgi:glycosyltransferase involved in cell wall biosynthesis